jgi:hypothetical protein
MKLYRITNKTTLLTSDIEAKNIWEVKRIITKAGLDFNSFVIEEI